MTAPSEKSMIITLVAITSLSIIAISAIIADYNHMITTSIISAITGLSGYRIGRSTK